MSAKTDCIRAVCFGRYLTYDIIRKRGKESAMRTSKSMRAAAMLLILTLMSSHIYSGTLAKYISTGIKSDTARVAKWGVEVSITGELFGEHYYSADDANPNEISASVVYNVDTAHNDNIVAPGTKNTKGMTIKISGTPEVATTVSAYTRYLYEEAVATEFLFIKGHRGSALAYAMLREAEGVTEDNVTKYYERIEIQTKEGTREQFQRATGFVAGKTYYELQDRVELIAGDSDYTPLNWYLKSKQGNEYVTKMYSSVADLAYDMIPLVWRSYEAGETIDQEYQIWWEWPIDGNDGLDTILGKLMAHKNQGNPSDWFVVKEVETNIYEKVIEGSDKDYNLEVSYDLKITATQVD